MKVLLSFFIFYFSFIACYSQNVGIGTKTPIDKLNVDSGNIRIGKDQWSAAANSKFLKIGDGNNITIGEEEANDKLTIRAKEVLIRPSSTGTTVPITIQGTSQNSVFYNDVNEDTYLRGGKSSSNIVIGSDLGGRVGISVYPQRAGLEQNGAVGNTAAIFGGDGTGISLQRNWPAIGFNSYLDGANHKSIGQGYGAQLGLNQINGSLYFVSFPTFNSPNTNFSSFNQRFYISKLGRLGLGTDDPQSDIHIVTRNYTELDENADMGLTFEGNYNFSNVPPLKNMKWNMHIGYGVSGSFGGLYFLNFWNNGGSGWSRAATIGEDGTYYQLSDHNLKKNIHYLQPDNLLNKIMQLNPASYLMKTDAANHPLHYGFIAQEVEKLFPEFVITAGTDTKMISYTGFIPILTKGMQEQQQEIEALKNEIAELKKLVQSK